MILRPGYVTKEKMEEQIGPLEIDKAIIAPDSGVKPKAPGMKYRHYAPRADLMIVEGPTAVSYTHLDVYKRQGP